MAERCAVCGNGVIEPHAGRLEQSGETYLPTTVWSCAVCGFARFDPAPGVSWCRADAPAMATATAVATRRRAA